MSKHREADWAGGINFIGSPNKKMQQLAFFHFTMLVGDIFLYLSKSESKTLSQKHQCLSTTWCQNQASDSSKTQIPSRIRRSLGCLQCRSQTPVLTELVCAACGTPLEVTLGVSLSHLPASSSGDETSIRWHHLQQLCPESKGIQDLETTHFPSSQPRQNQIKMVLPL